LFTIYFWMFILFITRPHDQNFSAILISPADQSLLALHLGYHHPQYSDARCKQSSKDHFIYFISVCYGFVRLWFSSLVICWILHWTLVQCKIQLSFTLLNFLGSHCWTLVYTELWFPVHYLSVIQYIFLLSSIQYIFL